jgi:hypothetical protein
MIGRYCQKQTLCLPTLHADREFAFPVSLSLSLSLSVEAATESAVGSTPPREREKVLMKEKIPHFLTSSASN